MGVALLRRGSRPSPTPGHQNRRRRGLPRPVPTWCRSSSTRTSSALLALLALLALSASGLTFSVPLHLSDRPDYTGRAPDRFCTSTMAEKPEAQARRNIDAALTAAGWVVQDVAGVNLRAGRGVAVPEFPLKPGHGFADYLLFVEGNAAGVNDAIQTGLAGSDERSICVRG